MPHAPTYFSGSRGTSVDIQLEVSNEPVIDAVHEVVVRVTATAKVKDKVLFSGRGKARRHFRNSQSEQRADGSGARRRVPWNHLLRTCAPTLQT
jgi:preprotein translocase subunit SecB